MVRRQLAIWGMALALLFGPGLFGPGLLGPELLGLGPLAARAGIVEVPGGGTMRLDIVMAPDRPQPVVGEMVLVTIRAVYDLKIANEKLEISAGDAFDWIQTRADDWHEERIDGLPRIVFERELAVWPKRAGMLQFGPVIHRLTVIDRQSKRQDITLTAKPVALSVGEFPAQRGWHFTAGALELSEELDGDPAKLADGQLLTRKIRLRALGALPEHLPPRPVVAENWLITFAPPVERNLLLTDAGPVAEAVWTWQLRPHTGEPGVLDAVKIPFYDTQNRRMAAVEIPALPLGYASFFTGQTPQGQIGRGQKALLALALGVGTVLGLGLAAFSLQPPTGRAPWARLLDRWRLGLWWRLWQARRQGDAMAELRLSQRLPVAPSRRQALLNALYQRPKA